MFKFFNALGHLLVLAVALRTGEPASSSDIAKVEEGYLKVSREIEKQINDQKFDFLDQLLSYDLVFERTALNIPAKMKTELSSELKGMLAKMLANTIQKPFTFKLLRIFLQRGETRAWFRLLNEKGFVYYQFVFKASNHGSIKIADFYSSSTGEWMSEFLRSSMLPYFANDPNAKLSPEDREILNHAEEIQKMRLLAQAGKWPEALEAYRRMPDLLQSNKMLLFFRLGCARQISITEVEAAMKVFKMKHPADASLEANWIDIWVRNSKFTEAIIALDRIETAVGGDPYLDAYKATIHLAAAKFHSRKALKEEPTLELPYSVLLGVSLKEGDFTAVVKTLSEMEKSFGLLTLDFEHDSLYSEFVKSKEYEEWKLTREKVQPPLQEQPGKK